MGCAPLCQVIPRAGHSKLSVVLQVSEVGANLVLVASRYLANSERHPRLLAELIVGRLQPKAPTGETQTAGPDPALKLEYSAILKDPARCMAELANHENITNMARAFSVVLGRSIDSVRSTINQRKRAAHGHMEAGATD